MFLKQEGRIYVDLNCWKFSEATLYWILLDRRGTIRDIEEQELIFEEGKIVKLWTDDADDNGEFDPLYFEGQLHFDLQNSEWVAIVDFDKLSYASESRLR